jgi:hypothetical protein
VCTEAGRHITPHHACSAARALHAGGQFCDDAGRAK